MYFLIFLLPFFSIGEKEQSVFVPGAVVILYFFFSEGIRRFPYKLKELKAFEFEQRILSGVD
jgi:hypothetical protein